MGHPSSFWSSIPPLFLSSFDDVKANLCGVDTVAVELLNLRNVDLHDSSTPLNPHRSGTADPVRMMAPARQSGL